ncbi:MAG: hypothetical protein DMF71_10290 [Acidobacteria bacterium]|nr:MAG: hypothetical protein DMF71_10290 [Acidobacteriota bacterium]
MKSLAATKTILRRAISSRADYFPRAFRENDPAQLAIISIVAVVALLPIMIYGIPNGADLANHLRFALPFHEAIQSGHFHPGWLAESNDGLGDPRFRFYPPGFYYLLSATLALTGGWFSATLAAFIVLSIVGGAGAYFWARTLGAPKMARWAGVLYVLAPYRLNELYQASLLSEYAACSILPFTFAFVERICRKPRAFDIAGLGAAYALLILTNLPLAVIGSISLAVYALLRIERKNFAATCARLGLAVIVALAASSFFWTTVIAELSWIKGSASTPNVYYDYRANFLFSPSALTNRNTWYANLLALAAIGFLLPAIVFIFRAFRKKNSIGEFKAALILLLATFLMATGLSRPLWAIVPKLSEVQFPWRWLAVTSLMGALLVAASIPQWIEQFRAKVRPRDLAVAFAFALACFFTVTQVIYDCDYLGHAKFDSVAHDVRGAVSFKDWLPIAARDVVHIEKMNGRVDAGNRAVTIDSWEPERRTFHVAAGPEPSLRVRTYFYPHWKAVSAGKTLPVSAAPDGTLLISAPAQAADIELVFQEPPRVHLFELVSALTWLLLIAMLGFGLIHGRERSRELMRSVPGAIATGSAFL